MRDLKHKTKASTSI